MVLLKKKKKKKKNHNEGLCCLDTKYGSKYQQKQNKHHQQLEISQLQKLLFLNKLKWDILDLTKEISNVMCPQNEVSRLPEYNE